MNEEAEKRIKELEDQHQRDEIQGPARGRDLNLRRSVEECNLVVQRGRVRGDG